jgi:hypothetical protein
MARKGNDIPKQVVDNEINLLTEKFSPSLVSIRESFLPLFAYNLNTFLNDMIAILVVNAAQNMVVKFNEQLRQSRFVQCLECLLNHTAATERRE